MLTTPKISVIIPCYKVEAWLYRAAESLQKQTFEEFEVILVDDGSPDTTGEICDALAKVDSRFTVIHQENAGAATARNNAMKQARGTYLYFMDGDDWCEETMLSNLYSCAVTNNLEVLVTGFYIDTYYGPDKFYRESRNAPDLIYRSQQDFREHAYELFDAQLLYAPWNKLYLRSYLQENNIEFPTTFWDDLPFNLDVFRNASRVGCLDGHYYHFLRAREESENTKYRPDMYDKREEEHVWLTDLFAFWGIDSEQAQEFLARRYAERLVGCIENVTNQSCMLSKEQKLAEIERMISTPQAKQALELAQPKSAMMRRLLAPMKAGDVRATMRQSQFISYVKSHNTSLFARLKAKRQSW